MAAEPVLEVRGLRVRIDLPGERVYPVDDVSFTVGLGECHGVVGESGSGKSLTLRAILGLLPVRATIESGAILLDGQDLTKLSGRAIRHLRGHSIGMVFQDPASSLNPVMRVGDQLREVLRVRNHLTRKKAQAEAVELARIVGLPDPERRLQSYPHLLSGGMKQRVGIALALASKPRLLLCDEPTTALDVTIQDQILRLLESLSRELGLAIVFVTHDLSVVEDLCHRVTVMYAGQVVESAGAANLQEHGRHPYTLALHASAPSMDERHQLVAIPGSPPGLSGRPDGCRFADRCGDVTDECRRQPVPLASDTRGRVVRCVHPRN